MIALIPARAGSKGLAQKNIKPLAGKPLIAHTIEQALAAEQVSQVVVSTDDERIAEVAKKYGAEVPFLRPAELAQDDSLAVDAYQYTLKKLEKETAPIDSVIILQPTSPLRQSADIDAAIELYKNKKADSVIGYTLENHPIIWHKYIKEDGSFEDIFDADLMMNRQEINKPSYYPNGAIFVLSRECINRRNFYTSKSYAYVMPRERSVDIDTLDDFEYVEFLISRHT